MNAAIFSLVFVTFASAQVYQLPANTFIQDGVAYTYAVTPQQALDVIKIYLFSFIKAKYFLTLVTNVLIVIHYTECICQYIGSTQSGCCLQKVELWTQDSFGIGLHPGRQHHSM